MNDIAQNTPSFSPHSYTGSANDIDVRALFLLLWRRKLMIGIVAALCVLATVIVLHAMTPRYTAKAQILIENANIPQSAGHAFKSNSHIHDEAEILRSRDLAWDVIDALNLTEDPDFNPGGTTIEQTQSSQTQQTKNNETDYNSRDFKPFSLSSFQMEELPPEITNQQTSGVINRFMKHLSVKTKGQSMTLEIGFTSNNPEKAALLANAVANIYIKERTRQVQQSSSMGSALLQQRLASLQDDLARKQEEREHYRLQHNLPYNIAGDGAQINLSNLQSRISEARAQEAEIKAQWNQIKRWKHDISVIETIPEVLNAPLIQDLKKQKIEIEQNIAELSLRYGEKHPRMINARKAQQNIQEKLEQEMGHIARSIESKLDLARARINSLQEEMGHIESGYYAQSQAFSGLKALDEEIESMRALYSKLFEDYKTQDGQSALIEPKARVLSYATVPLFPSWPNVKLFAALAAIMGLFIGTALALLLEKLDNVYRSISHLESQNGFSCYGLVPMAGRLKTRDAAGYILTSAATNLAESLRSLRMVLNLRTPVDQQKPKVITITSSYQGEGKSTLSIWLARLAAKSGENVLLIDCDLRRPSLHRMLGKKPDVTLVDYLQDKADLEDTVNVDAPTGLNVICAASLPQQALDLISTEKFETLIKDLRDDYDLIILDAPATIPVSDAKILARQSDHTFYIVTWNQTPRDTVQMGVKQFTDMGYRNLSFVMNKMDLKKQSRYGYGDIGYGYES